MKYSVMETDEEYSEEYSVMLFRVVRKDGEDVCFTHGKIHAEFVCNCLNAMAKWKSFRKLLKKLKESGDE